MVITQALEVYVQYIDCPLEIEVRTIDISVLSPPTFQEIILEILVTPLDNEDLRLLINGIGLFPRFEIRCRWLLHSLLILLRRCALLIIIFIYLLKGFLHDLLLLLEIVLYHLELQHIYMYRCWLLFNVIFYRYLYRDLLLRNLTNLVMFSCNIFSYGALNISCSIIW